MSDEMVEMIHQFCKTGNQLVCTFAHDCGHIGSADAVRLLVKCDFLDLFIAFFTQIVLNLAGIRSGIFRRNTQLYQKLRQYLMTRINSRCNRLTRRQQGDIAIGIHLNIPVFP